MVHTGCPSTWSPLLPGYPQYPVTTLTCKPLVSSHHSNWVPPGSRSPFLPGYPGTRVHRTRYCSCSGTRYDPVVRRYTYLIGCTKYLAPRWCRTLVHTYVNYNTYRCTYYLCVALHRKRRVTEEQKLHFEILSDFA